VDISFTVYFFVILCVRLRISRPRIKLGVEFYTVVYQRPGRVSPIFGNVTNPKTQNGTNRPATVK